MQGTTEIRKGKVISLNPLVESSDYIASQITCQSFGDIFHFWGRHYHWIPLHEAFHNKASSYQNMQ